MRSTEVMLMILGSSAYKGLHARQPQTNKFTLCGWDTVTNRTSVGGERGGMQYTLHGVASALYHDTSAALGSNGIAYPQREYDQQQGFVSQDNPSAKHNHKNDMCMKRLAAHCR